MGSGSYISGKFNLRLTFFGFDSVDPVLQNWKDAFQNASEMLFQATHGKMQFGTLAVTHNGAWNDYDDMFLLSMPGCSFTSLVADPLTGQAMPMGGRSWLHSDEQTKPFVIVHEFGHHGFTLGDEYFHRGSDCKTPSTPACVVDPSLSCACIMEFDWETASENSVAQFCNCKIHDAAPLTGQNLRHNKMSCWQTIKKIMKSEFGTEIENPESIECQGQPEGHEPVIWNTLSKTNKFMFAIVGSKRIADSFSDLAIKNYLSFWAQLQVNQGNYFGVVTNASVDNPEIPLVPITDKLLPQILQAIDKLELSGGRTFAETLSTAFDEVVDGRVSELQAIYVVTPGEEESHQNNSTNSLAPGDLDANFVRVFATCVGHGETSKELLQLDRKTRRVESLIIADDNPDNPNVALSIQSRNVELAFLSRAGAGIVGYRAGRFLARKGDAPPKPAIELGSADPLNFEMRKDTSDYPVYVEDGSSNASFVLSQLKKDEIAFALIDPDGIQIPAQLNRTEAESVSWYSVKRPKVGRWILRLRRKRGNHEIPFRLMAFSENSRLFISFNAASARDGKVAFNAQTNFPFPLVHVRPIVEVYRSKSGNTANHEMIEIVPLEPPTARPSSTAADSAEKIAERDHEAREVELASGNFRGQLELDSGNYAAILRVDNAGTAAYATNLGEVPEGNLSILGRDKIPAFIRFARVNFVVEQRK